MILGTKKTFEILGLIVAVVSGVYIPIAASKEWFPFEKDKVIIIDPPTQIVPNKAEKDSSSPGDNCAKETVILPMNEYTFIPKHVSGGDREFEGNGPKVKCRVEYIVTSNRIYAKIYMKARETKSNWTTAEGEQTLDLVQVEAGKKIVGIEGNSTSSREYTDTNHGIDQFSEVGRQPVKKFYFTGDVSGSESGSVTKVRIVFNPLVYFIKDRNCE